MFKKILIANRGEIACRIMRTAHAMNISTVAVYSDADKQSEHVKQADHAYFIGGAKSQDSYLHAERILSVAKTAGCDAIHPGYGFLSENAAFAELCAQHHLHFIGPSVHAITVMGSKALAKQLALQHHLPVIKGYHDHEQSDAALLNALQTIGYPALIKAAAGGGGKGMRIVLTKEEAPAALAACRREAKASFGDDTLILEQYLPTARHIEMQLFGDQHGQLVYLFTRDCSIQRRHQKIIEEAPAFALSEAIQQRMAECAITLARAVNYVGAGTVEFLLTDEQFYFMEMNTRLQVEHPVTEMITQQDLVEWQIRIAAGEPLPLQQHELSLQGHSIEVRICAEDPDEDFLPAIGQIGFLKTPEITQQVRIDTGVIQGDTITPYYDSMIAKLIVWGSTRAQAVRQLQQALTNYRVVGVKTNLPFLQAILAHPAYQTGHFATDFITRYQHELLSAPPIDVTLSIAACLLALRHRTTLPANSNDYYSPWFNAHPLQLNLTMQQRLILRTDKQTVLSFLVTHLTDGYDITLNEEIYKIRTITFSATHVLFHVDTQAFCYEFIETAQAITLFSQQQTINYQLLTMDYGHHTSQEILPLTAPMPGIITNILVTVGKKVLKGEPLLIVEAMKMEHTIKAPRTGTIDAIHFAVGDQVNEGVDLLSFKES